MQAKRAIGKGEKGRKPALAGVLKQVLSLRCAHKLNEERSDAAAASDGNVRLSEWR